MSGQAFPVFLAGLGAATCLGTSLCAAAAARARMTRFEARPDRQVVDPLSGKMVLLTAGCAPVAASFEGRARIVPLAIAAIEDLRANIGEEALLPDARLYFALAPSAPPAEEPDEPSEDFPPEVVEPSPSPAQWALATATQIAKLARLPHPPAAGDVQVLERLGALLALQAAMAAVAHRQVRQALVVATDSTIDEWKLGPWLKDLRVKTPERPVGFIPGEGAVALLLEADHRGMASPLLLHPPDIQPERVRPNTLADGRLLASALAAACARVGSPGTLISDLNGEEPRATELGGAMSLPDHASRFRGPELVVPAAAFGETGAASPFLGLLLAERGLRRGYAPGNSAIVLVSGDDGTRAAIAIGKHQGA